MNSAIRYELLSRGDDSHTKFYIDAMSGDIRSMVTFNLDGGKMYGFDVKATDSEGSENGNSATTTVFVSVVAFLLNHRRQLMIIFNLIH